MKESVKTLSETHHEKLLETMSCVFGYRERLNLLRNWWAAIAMVGKIHSDRIANQVLDAMGGTKTKFEALQIRLIDTLLMENLQKVILDDSSKCQVAIDILIRNLFERTADVGFLATDDDLRAFLLKTEPSEDEKGTVRNRLNEYVKKYSVYDDIIVLRPTGEVAAHLDLTNKVEFTRDALIHQAIHTKEEYLETYRHTDLRPTNDKSLIYSCKITENNKPGSAVLGVLCLCFRFEDEMEGIFSHLLPEGSNSVLMLLDEHEKVIASSDQTLTPIGMPFRSGNSPNIINHKKRECLVNSTKTQGYQDFFGLDWSGAVLSSLRNLNSSQDDVDEDDIQKDVLDQAKMFSEELLDIKETAASVNSELRLIVNNGLTLAVRKKANEFTPILNDIRQIGIDLESVFTDSIRSLHITTITSRLNNAKFNASLAVDIMDRNLYERANDCRWWALTSEFRKILSRSTITEKDTEKMSEILAYINNLYTVYTNLYLYDRNCVVAAVSHGEEKSLVGQQLSNETGAQDALLISDSQKYTVSSFSKSPLYNNRHTYIYNSSITDLVNPNNVVGGIGIVFDSEPQFESILFDTLPRDGNGQIIEKCFGILLDRSGHIISALRNDKLQVGDVFNIEPSYLQYKNGSSASSIIEYEGEVYGLGVAVSGGYREYKTTNDYHNDVICFLFVPF